MAVAAKKISQVASYIVIGFAIAYVMTGSVVLGGLAVLLEPVLNVILLPFHEHAWAGMRARAASEKARYAVIAAEKVSQTGLHMVIAFGVMFWATGSAAVGGLAAVLEPICNVVLMPLHDRAWDRFLARGFGTGAGRLNAA
ncbi:Uncharacterized membrane protein [Noviherbaspirillum humi]|uniref:Uncharacterized membrane protein n=1 Tax=Noviherbaspirillum humi TaxID=1688639 RepID=A0A239KMT1_9BURK|nr:DUF2061 domain-containing protein [Noviherbaspirillum humi]SNT18474.1 Uncharacterized membrane protein [Noviherbaspirillum humi]